MKTDLAQIIVYTGGEDMVSHFLLTTQKNREVVTCALVVSVYTMDV